MINNRVDDYLISTHKLFSSSFIQFSSNLLAISTQASKAIIKTRPEKSAKMGECGVACAKYLVFVFNLLFAVSYLSLIIPSMNV